MEQHKDAVANFWSGVAFLSIHGGMIDYINLLAPELFFKF